ncbi:MAG: flagellar biosynthesis protein FlhB [Spirochaetales bacterium]|nr:flagellar biosynthesis protein FlhB [Spirochaetales bacterium]
MITAFDTRWKNPWYEEKEPSFYIHLQWFAAEDEGRTEEPTELKLKKAREEGKVAKSADLTSAMVLLIAIIGLLGFSSYLMETFQEMMIYFFFRSTELDLTESAVTADVFFRFLLRLMLPLAAVCFVAAFFGNVLQVGFLFSAKPITPDFNKIVPKFGKFFQRAFFSGEAAFNLMKSVVKIIIIGIIAYINISSKVDIIIHFVHVSFLEAYSVIARLAFMILTESAIAMLLFAIPDYMFQKKQHIESLKMSKQEVKEERKTTEGDPLVRSRLRERMRELLSSSMLRNVPRATVVVTNPTHYAVALEWRRDAMPAPVVIAKGADNMAFRIREIATEAEVPIIENKPLARALYAEVELGDVIPAAYYEAMAIIIAEVYKIKGLSAAV